MGVDRDHDDEFCPALLEDLSDLPEERTVADLQRPSKGSRREASEWARLLADAGSSPAGEVLHDPDGEPLVRTAHDAELAILGLDPDSMHPECDWCQEEERPGLKPEVRGRWFMHLDCYVDAEQHNLGSLSAPPRSWAWDEQSPAPACGLRSKPRPPALTDEKIVEVVSLRQWEYSQAELAKRLGVNQASVSRALTRREERGVRLKRIKGQQLSIIDWFGGWWRRGGIMARTRKKRRGRIVLFYRNTLDGFGSTWIAQRRFGLACHYWTVESIAPRLLEPTDGYGNVYVVGLSVPDDIREKWIQEKFKSS